jgi:drug/metabolite transporter (DMT)-like permease
MNAGVKDWLWLTLLASVCTAFPFIATAKILKHIKSFTVILAINLEPVYTIIFAWMIFGESEKMNLQFYIGTGVILCTLFLNAYLKTKLNK